ncbi:hypothetical protein [Aeromicrobium duanguangcaii]|uniref:Ribosome maturation factor RimP n=1 Tax=Aeromicrobium duanguangcaii TaxID=2968086 RepID=A0ABY5KHR7_9ACTN|nr:hypothetical protein [Aeromicrobium duanguangcaii]MCD9153576.1 hypothetical protein [Aeromicrobium duanguangcaii]UUI69339.1 hypothetical protein NP095_04335 [Aeromicrobium duanguangcaii]
MRWDRLFTDLEGAAVDAHAEERDALAEDLRDEQWSRLSWTDLLGGPDVRLEVAGLGEIRGRVVGVGDVVLVEDGLRTIVVLPEAIVAISGSDGRASAAPALRRTRGQLARALRDAGARVRVVRRDGRAVEGVVAAVGSDFVQITATGRSVSLPWASIAALEER